MSSLERIIERILEEAEQEAKKDLAAIDEEKSLILSEGKKQALLEGEQLISRAKEESQLEKERMIASAKLQGRDKILSKRLEILQRCFDEAKSRLDQLDDQDYVDFVKRTLSRLPLSGGEKLVVPEDKRELLKGILPLSDEVSGAGFIVEKEGLRYNFQFDELLDYKREELQDEIYGLLFSRKE